MTEAAIHPRIRRDLFVALGEPLGQGAWSMRIQYKPFIRLIWLGALFMALAAFFGMTDKRYRAARGSAQTAPAGDAASCRRGCLMKSLKYLLPAVAFLVLAGFFYRGLFLDPRTVPSPLIGKPAPAFELQDVAPAERPFCDDGHARQAGGVERLGDLVRRVPPGASTS
jgi:hypothetical protein